MECYTSLRNVTDLLSDGKTPYERRFGQPFKGPIIPFAIWFIGWVLPYNWEGSVTHSINLERKFYLDCSSDTLCTREEFGKVTYWSQTLRSWKRWTHRKSTRKDSMRKRWYFPNKENLFFQSQMDESKPLEKIRNWEHPPWYGNTHFEEKVTEIFLENQNRLFLHLKTHFRMPVKQFTIFGPCREASYTAITLNQESNLTRREKNHSLFHWSTLTLPELLIRIWMSSKRNASMIIGISMDQEICLFLGQVTHNLLLLKEQPPDGYMWSGWRLTRKQLTSRPDHLWPALEVNGKARQAEGEPKVV